MRPDRFQSLLLDHLPSVPGITKAVSFADSGYDRSLYGVVLHHHNGACTWWQPVATSRTGDDYAKPEGVPVTGERVLEMPLPDLTGPHIETSEVEAAIAATLTRADAAGEIARIQRYSLREQPGATSHGLTVDFHDTSRIFVYGLAATRQGHQPSAHHLFKIGATV